MANVTIPNLTSATTITPSSDLLVVEQTAGTRKATVNKLFTNSATQNSGLGITSGGVYSILGSTSISGIGDGSVTGAISSLNSNLSASKSHVGMIIHSTTLNTEAKVKEIYGGTTWIQHSGYFLRGADTGVTADDANYTGGADEVTLTAAQCGVPAHAHKMPTKYTINSGAHSHSSAGNYVADAPNTSEGPSNIYTDNNNAVNASQAHNNIPKYKSVYIWERTA